MYLLINILKRIIFLITQRIVESNQKNDPQVAIFAFDRIALKIMIYGQFEKEELNVLRREVFSKIDPQKHCLDIGANIGNHSLAFAKHFSVVHAFEPNERTFNLLKINSKLVSNIIPYNIGASNCNATFDASENNTNYGNTRIIDKSQEAFDITTIQFECKILDEYLPQEVIERIGFIKIDVEGHEHASLLGCRKIIESYKPVIVFELLKEDISNNSSDVYNYLKNMGYSCFYEMNNSVLFRKKLQKMDNIKYKKYKMIVASCFSILD